MTLADETRLLGQMRIFEGVDPAKLKLLAFSAHRIPCFPGEVLFNQGDYPDSVYVVLEGELDVLHQSGGSSIRVARLGQGELIGEIGVLCDRPRNATVTAATPAKVLRLESDVFIELVREIPAISMSIINELSTRLDSMNQQLAEARHMTGSPPE